MNLSAEKRKMPRMNVGFSACIFWGIAQNQSEVNIRNLSIHGISFRANKYFTRGTRFNLILPNQRRDSKANKIQAEVVRCETLNGFSSDGKFKVGAKFSFKAHGSTGREKQPTINALSPLQPIDSQSPLFNICNEKLINYPVPANAIGTQGSPALRIRVMKIDAKLIQSVRTPTREKTAVTSIQIKQVQFISSPSTPSSTLTTSLRDGSQKLFSPQIAKADRFF